MKKVELTSLAGYFSFLELFKKLKISLLSKKKLSEVKLSRDLAIAFLTSSTTELSNNPEMLNLCSI